MVSKRGIEAYPDKIRAILDMPTLRIEKEIGGFLGRLQYIILVPPTPGRPLLLYLSVSNIALGCMLTHLDDSGNEWLVLLAEFDIHYVTQKFIRWSIVVDHLASLPISDGKTIDDDFSYEDIVAVTSLLGWHMYFDGVANHSRYRIEIALKLGIRQMEVFGDSNLVLRQIQGHWKTRNVKLSPYHAYLELLVGRFDDLSYTHLPRVVSDTWGPHSRATFKVTCTDFTMAIFNMGYRHYWKISPKSSSGQEFILVFIDYFTKWVEAPSYARLTSSWTNETVEVANKNINRILQRMIETSRDWSEKLPFALWAYQISFHTFTGATPYSLMYGIEAVLSIEMEMGSCLSEEDGLCIQKTGQA
ncbi:hypothetical protein CK203_039430 [Vitis vinifera]|uniref:RNase H type-1 domain-containing protein n=1 Tax=Vitis vinifera TaxID=29760 RepID=A0A438I7E1_VITVI|nr:hypothetical protein CK203_039430 [Vitis vinifera]